MEPKTSRIQRVMLGVAKFRSVDRTKKLRYTAYAVVVLLLIVGALLVTKEVFNSKQNNHVTVVADNPVVVEYRKKLPQLKAAARQKPDDASARIAYAQALYVTGDKQMAKAEYEAALRLNPTNASVTNNLGNVYRDLKQYDAAASAYKRAFELDPSLANAYINLATMQTYTLKKPADAVATYKLAISKNGQSSELLLLLGGAYEQNHQNDLAVSTYRAVLDKDPHNTAAQRDIERLTKH